VNYELYMGAALAEARAAGAAGERPDGAVGVLDDAMVAHGRERVRETGDPTAHAVMLVLREATRRLGRASLNGLTVFVAAEPCVMCVGAMLESDADGVVYAVPDPKGGACGSVVQVAHNDRLPRHLRVVSGIMQGQAEEIRQEVAARVRG
jgi:tRNA(adenine34) deaminase